MSLVKAGRKCVTLACFRPDKSPRKVHQIFLLYKALGINSLYLMTVIMSFAALKTQGLTANTQKHYLEQTMQTYT